MQIFSKIEQLHVLCALRFSSNVTGRVHSHHNANTKWQIHSYIHQCYYADEMNWVPYIHMILFSDHENNILKLETFIFV